MVVVPSNADGDGDDDDDEHDDNSDNADADTGEVNDVSQTAWQRREPLMS